MPWCHSWSAPVLDTQVLQSEVTAQDSTGSTLSRGWNGEEQQMIDLDAVIRNVTPCALEPIHERFGETYRLHLQKQLTLEGGGSSFFRNNDTTYN